MSPSARADTDEGSPRPPRALIRRCEARRRLRRQTSVSEEQSNGVRIHRHRFGLELRGAERRGELEPPLWWRRMTHHLARLEHAAMFAVSLSSSV
jgi:hypothetical protein